MFIQFDIWGNVTKAIHKGETYQIFYIKDEIVKYENSFGDYWLKGDSVRYCPYATFNPPHKNIRKATYEIVYAPKSNKFIIIMQSGLLYVPWTINSEPYVKPLAETVITRYSRKIVNPNFYGTITI